MSELSLQQKLRAKIGAAAVALLVPMVVYFEGTVFKTYPDPIGILTSCNGHTGSELKLGQTFTPAQCETVLYKDLLSHADDIDCVKAPITDGQKAAYISFSYNVGKVKFCKSTMVKKANAGDKVGSCNEFPRWTLAGGRELQGLVKRREAEKKVCLS